MPIQEIHTNRNFPSSSDQDRELPAFRMVTWTKMMMTIKANMETMMTSSM